MELSMKKYGPVLLPFYLSAALLAPLNSGVLYHSTGPHGEWTTLELYALGRQSIQVINGHVIMALDNIRLKDGTPLSAGKIQLQSEGAEVYYRDVRIQPITEFPEEIQKASGLNAPAPAKSK